MMPVVVAGGSARDRVSAHQRRFGNALAQLFGGLRVAVCIASAPSSALAAPSRRRSCRSVEVVYRALGTVVAGHQPGSPVPGMAC